MKRVRAEVLGSRRLGAYRCITLVAPEIAERVRPGQFISIAMPPDREFILRRHFSVHAASKRGGWAGTLEFVFDTAGRGTEWLAEARPHSFLDVIGPLGRPFAYPARLNACLLVSEGRGSASLHFLAHELKANGKRVDMLIGAADEEHVLKPLEAKRVSQTVQILTADGSLGDRGAVADVLPAFVDAVGTEVVYAAGSRTMLRAVAEFCLERRIPAQIAVEEQMACALGMCYSCVVPIIRKDGSGYENLRACTEGPVFNPARVFWDLWIGEEPQAMLTPPEGFPVVRTWPG